MTTFPTVYEGLEPSAVWHHFGALNAIPRPSGQEEAARAYVQEVAESRRAMWKTDARGNICVRVPARGAAADAPIVVLQSHLDMVCQKRPDVKHDFDHDPIAPRRVDDRIYASGTTLGADNGMGAAMMLAVLTSDDLKHGPLELLFTVEEETGLFGAAFLDPELVRGRLLVNLDSEDPEEITIGCAGGASTSLHLPVQLEALNSDDVVVHIGVGGLQGGHSGIQIGEPLANAIQLVGQILNAAAEECPDLRLIDVQGGTAHNAIPRDAQASIALPASQLLAFNDVFDKTTRDIEMQWRNDEPGLSFLRENGTIDDSNAIVAADTVKALSLLSGLPHGVIEWSQRFEGKVQTSCNFAAANASPSKIEFSVSNRSFVAAELKGMQTRVADLGRAVGADIEVRDGYPGWEPSANSPLVAATAVAYEKAMGHPAKVEVVHAGLECGLLSEKLDGLDAVSFGPLIRGAHTPEEWVSISSVGEMYRVLVTLLENL
ncbi:aminoacyl-histidine dipeptidase [bacterium]|nr:MAG: aminoacyl-histidine dipeptidase [bacterium]